MGEGHDTGVQMMFATASRCRKLLWVLPALMIAPPALGQMDRLREQDGQFIEGLREAGLSDLLGRFVEQMGDANELGAIEQHILIIAQQEFAATEKLNAAIELSATYPAEAEAMFVQSRQAYEALLAAQQKMIEDNADDERVPLWETDLASMLLDKYLPTYWNNAGWFYEFGVCSAEQSEAFERSVVLAFTMVADASFRIEQLTGRMARDGGVLRTHLEELGLYFKLREEYEKRRVPFWFSHCAYYVALLPADHAYYTSLGRDPRLRNQASSPQAERTRLLEMAEAIATGSLLNDAEVGTMMRLLGGRVLVATGDRDRADEGVADYLEGVMTGSADGWQGFLATLTKARGRAVAGEMDTATEILSGMDRHPFVTQQLAHGNFYPRLLAADLLHRMLREPAELARGADRRALLAQAYELPYLELINNDRGNRYAPFLYRRWAEQIDPNEDAAALPPVVRMGVGQIKLEIGSGMAKELIYLALNAPLDSIAIPADRERETARRVALRAQAEQELNRSVAFNQTLVGDDADVSVRDRGLMNLAFGKYYLAEMTKYYGGDGPSGVAAYFEVAKLWAQIGIEMPDSSQAQSATGFAVTLLQQFDQLVNSGPQGVTNTSYREAYREAIDVMYENWPSDDIAHALRVYTGFYVYELSGDLDQAIEVYRGTPPEHSDYFEARRQMILAMQKQYDQFADAMRGLELAGPVEDTDAARMALDRTLSQQGEDLERMRRELLDTAELLEIDAQDEAANGSDARRRFSAATARGGALVAVAAMEADGGDTDAAIDILDGFENDYKPTGQLAPLVAVQPNPENAQAQLDGLIQSAQERRILALVKGAQLDDADDLNRISRAAEAMIESYPDVAAGVVNGVLRRIEEQIKSFVIARDSALLNVNRDEAQGRITKLAGVAVRLSELLVTWARGKNYEGMQLLPFETGLCRALLLSQRPGDAVPIMQNWLEEYPDHFDVVMLTADCLVADARQRNSRTVASLNPALELYYKMILFYNARPGAKPDRFWDAWLKVLQTMEYAGGDLAQEIGAKVRMLQNRVDEDLGGDEYRPQFLEIASRHL